VSNDKKLLFQTEPDRFQQIVTNDDPEQRFASACTLDDLLLAEVIRYGMFNKQEMIRPLRGLYRQLASKMSEEDRYSVFGMLWASSKIHPLFRQMRYCPLLLKTKRE
jgi:hypothetical protein